MYIKFIFTAFIFSAAYSVAAFGASGVGAGGGGDRPLGLKGVEMASAAACEHGPYVYLLEEVPGANRPVPRKVLYVCVDGIYRREGKVPRYNRCAEGESRMNAEWVTHGNHEREIKVRYTCIGGRFQRNP